MGLLTGYSASHGRRCLRTGSVCRRSRRGRPHASKQVVVSSSVRGSCRACWRVVLVVGLSRPERLLGVGVVVLVVVAVLGPAYPVLVGLFLASA